MNAITDCRWRQDLNAMTGNPQLHHHIQIIQVKQSLGPSSSLLKCCPVYHHSAGTGAVHPIFLNQVLIFDKSDFLRCFSGFGAVRTLKEKEAAKQDWRLTG